MNGKVTILSHLLLINSFFVLLCLIRPQNQSTSANGRLCALCDLAAGQGPLRRAAWLLLTLIYSGPANEGWQTRWERKVWGSSLTKSCNYSFTTLIFPADSPTEPDRTRPTATHAGTAHALFTGEWPFLFKDTMIQMCPVLSPWGKVNRWKRDVERSRGCKTNVDAVNEHMGTCDIYTLLPLSIYASDSPTQLHSLKGVKQE